MANIKLIEDTPQKGFWTEKERKLFQIYKLRKYSIAFVIGKTGYFTIYTKNSGEEVIGGMGFLHTPEQNKEFLAMFKVMENWFSDRGVKRFFAPMDFNTWHRYRIPSSNPEHPPFPGEMEYPFHLNQWFEEMGMAVVKKYYSYIVEDWEGVLRYLKPGVRRGEKAGLRIEKGKKNMETLKIVYNISCEAFKNAFLFERIPFHEFVEMYSANMNDGILLIAWFHNQPVGFVFGYPWHGILIEKTVAVLPEYRDKFAGTLLIHRMYLTGIEMGCKKFIHAFMRASISTHIFSARFGKVYREYSLYGKELK